MRRAGIPILLAAVAIAAFAWTGPTKLPGLAAIGMVALAGVSLLPGPYRILALPFAPLALLTPQLGPGYYLFDGVGFVLGCLGLWITLTADDRRVWDIGYPGACCLLALVSPFLALPTQVSSLTSFLGLYKQIVMFVVVFLSLRRLVPPEKSSLLLWTFPIVGLAASLQLLGKAREAGGNLFLRLGFRNFFTSVGWGASNYIAALIVVCLLGTLMLLFVERRLWRRALLLGAGAVMLSAFIVLFSRGATVGLGVAILVFVIGWGSWRGLLVAGFSAAVGFALVLTPGGRVLSARFSDPSEYASWYTRIIGWQEAWQRFLSHPLTGIGLNQGRYQNDQLAGDSSHNIFLEYMMEQGILGGILLLIVFISAYRLAWRAHPVESAASPRVIRVLAVASITGILVNANVEPTINGYVVGMLFVWFLAWLALQDPAARKAPAAS